jgi:hypothetical protein
MMHARIARAALAATLAAGPLSAQGTCDLDVSKPFQLSSAALYLVRHDQSASADDKLKNLKSAVNVLTDNPGRIKNEPARNFLLGQAYVIWFKDAGARLPLRAKRGDLGIAENPEGDFSLPDALDEAFGVVEREKPACAERTARFRNAVFNDVLNKAIAFSRAAQHDSAIAWANSALRVNARSPLAGTAYQVISVSSRAKGDLGGAIASLRAAIEKMGNDPASVAGKATATYNLGIFTRDDALAQSGERKSAGLRAAATLFQGYLDISPDGEFAAAARAARMQALRDAGDSASVSGILGDMLANPARYSALQLFEAGVGQGNAQKWVEAARLYEAGLQMNPYYRDALFNLANVYFAQHLPERMAPVVARLRGADPMNPDVLKMAAAVWQERASQAAEPKAKKSAQDSTSAYLELAAKLPARVTVQQFLVGRDGKVTLTGTVENLTTTSRDCTIAFELLDAAGGVVGRGEVKVGPLGPRASAPFNPQLVAATAVAWRYAFK